MEIALAVVCAAMTLVKTMVDPNVSSGYSVSFQRTRYTRVTITKRLQTTRLRAALTCAMMSVVSEADRKSIMEWGIVMTVMKSDEANAEMIIILLLRERLKFFQNCSGTQPEQMQ